MRPSVDIPVRRPASRVLLELDLSRGLQEAPPASPVEALRAMHVPSLRGVVEGLRRAARDRQVDGLIAHIGAKQPTLAQSGELRAAAVSYTHLTLPTICRV